MNDGALDLDLAALPKAELHCHLDGVLDPAMARDLRARDPAFPVSPEQLEAALPVVGYDSFQAWWQATDALSGRLPFYHGILAAHVGRLVAQNVTYAEVMIAAGEIPDDPIMAMEGVRALRATADRAAGTTLQVEFNVAFGRNKPPDRIEAITRKILALRAGGLIVGVALAGPEAGYPAHPFRRQFDAFREAGLGLEVHAGEWCGPESVWDALESARPPRIGHAVAAFADPRLLAVLRERGVHLELCPTCNLATGSVRRIEDHPVARARDLGLRFSVNTDDPGVVGCSMTTEYATLASVFGFGASDFEAIYRDTLAAAFAHVRCRAP